MALSPTSIGDFTPTFYRVVLERTQKHRCLFQIPAHSAKTLYGAIESAREAAKSSPEIDWRLKSTQYEALSVEHPETELAGVTTVMKWIRSVSENEGHDEKFRKYFSDWLGLSQTIFPDY